ncbi:MAG: hypothetical protein KF860_15870 [Cyclobacteriaceae bacterium]|nr:hypothetical protein [Cyclobacteriaceae bacterium]
MRYLKNIILLLLGVSYWVDMFLVHVILMLAYAALILAQDIGGRNLKRFDVSTTYAFLLLITNVAHMVVLSGLSDDPWFFTKSYSEELSGKAIFVFNMGSVVILEALRFFIKIDNNLSPTQVRSLQLKFWPVFLISAGIFSLSNFINPLLWSVGSVGSFISLIVQGSILLLSFIAHSTKRNIIVVLLYTVFLSVWALQYSFLRMTILIPWVAYLSGDIIASGSLYKIHSYSKGVVILAFLIFPPLFTFLGNKRSDLYGKEKLSASVNLLSSNQELEGQSITSRLSIIPQVSNIILLTRKNGFYNGETLSYFKYVFIPRFIWPDKPLIRQGQWFAVEIGNAYYNKQGKANNSVNMTVPGEFYLNFGWTGLIMGCLLFGGVMATIWNVTDYNSLYGWVFRFYLIFLGLFSLGADLQVVPTLVAYVILYKALLFVGRFF